MGEVEYGICDLCGVVDYVSRKYYHYDIKCECHSPHHFELITHCKNCEPVAPTTTVVHMKPMTAEDK